MLILSFNGVAFTYCIILIYVKSDRSIIEYFSVLNYKMCCFVKKKIIIQLPNSLQYYCVVLSGYLIYDYDLGK